MPLTFLAEGFPLGGLIFIGAIVALILFAVIASVIKRAGRARAMKELAEREGWSYAASDKDVARCLATFSQLRQAPRNLLVFRRGELAITFGDITLSQPTRVNNKRNTSAGRAASFCQVEGRGLDAPNLSLMKKPEIPPQLAKMMGSLAKVDIEGLMGAASIALPDDSEGFAKELMIEGPDTEAVRAYLNKERRRALRPIFAEEPLVALRKGALVLVSKTPVPPEQARGFCEKARALYESLA